MKRWNCGTPCVNGDPANASTQAGPYCLIEDAVQQMLNLACRDTLPSDPQMQYYVYQNYALEVQFIVSFDACKTQAAECEDGRNEQAAAFPIGK